MADISQSNWTESDASNSTAAPDGAPEGMATAGVNDTMRAMMGATKRSWRRNSVVLTGGTSTAFTLTYGVAPSGFADGETFLVQFNQACGASPTLNVNALGALPIHKYFGGVWGTLAANDVTTDLVCRVAYNSGAGAYRIVASSSFFPLSSQSATTFLAGGDISLNNTASFFSGPSTGSIGANGQTWLIMAAAFMTDTNGPAQLEAAIYNGSTYIADALVSNGAANFPASATLMAVVTLAGATTFTLQAKDQTSTGGLLRASGSVVSNKATSITAIRLS
jgi:hypothetical protein